MFTTPARRLIDELYPYFHPFASYRPQNALEGFATSSLPLEDNVSDGTGLQVLFLSCKDLRNLFVTAIGSTHIKNLDFHVNDASPAVIARLILLLKIISSLNFDPEDEKDLGYVWNVWYDATWPQSTLNRFIEDVKGLLSNEHPLPENISIPDKSQKDDVRNIWTGWISTIETSSVADTLTSRSNFLVKYWSLVKRLCEQNQDMTGLSFSASVERAVKRLELKLFDFENGVDRDRDVGCPLSENLHQEVKKYFTTGNCGGSATESAFCSNPTLLDLVNGKWYVHYAACPFDGYLPLPPWRELTESAHGQGLILSYCKMDLKKLLIDFRKRVRDVKFSFYSCDALAYCYQDSLLKFDVIATSNLADVVGLVNVLNAATRKLRSARSVLVTETFLWTDVAPTVPQYLQEVLCCPLSLIPTIYGVRLIDDVNLGPENPPNARGQLILPTRIRWMTALAIKGIPLVSSSTLDRCLKQLRDECFRLSASSIGPIHKLTPRCGMDCYSPLTFRYVVSDMIRRGVFRDPATLMSSAFSRLPPVFRKSLETAQAWEDIRPVWRVKLPILFHLNVNNSTFRNNFALNPPAFRLILIPRKDYQSVINQNNFFPEDREKNESVFYKLNSTGNHFFDNLDVNMKSKSDGMIHHIEVSFLLHDRSLLKSHSPLVICFNLNYAVVHSYTFSGYGNPDKQTSTCPWIVPMSPFLTESSGGNRWLVAESGKESEKDYSIRFKVHQSASSNPKPVSELKVSIDCNKKMLSESAYRITVKLNDVEPLTVTLPHPIVSDTIKATLLPSEGVVDIVAAKALYDVWPDHVIQPDNLRWNVEKLKPWARTDLSDNQSPLMIHLRCQLPLRFCENGGWPLPSNLEARSVSDDWIRLRFIIGDIFHLAADKKDQLRFQLKIDGSSETADWYIRAHLPIRVSPLGTPILLLSAVDQRLSERLQREGNLKIDQAKKDLHRIYGHVSEEEKIVIPIDAEVARLFRYVLRLNSTKIGPTQWQEENIPRGKATTPQLFGHFHRLSLPGLLFL